MVSSLVNWLQDKLGQGEAVELLLSGLLLLHLLVIIFFVFSRGNASAFLQWFTNGVSKSTLFWLKVKMMPSSYKWDLWLFVMFTIIYKVMSLLISRVVRRSLSCTAGLSKGKGESHRWMQRHLKVIINLICLAWLPFKSEKKLGEEIWNPNHFRGISSLVGKKYICHNYFRKSVSLEIN